MTNVTGSLLIDLCAGLLASERSKSPVVDFLMTGFCGGFTTFSAFSLQTLDLMKNGA